MKEFEFNSVKFYVGQSAKENWELLDKANQTNIWFHLDSFKSPYVIMCCSIDILEELQNTSENIPSVDHFLYYGANLCKEYSKYKYLKDIKVMYTDIKNVSKGTKLGEAIIKGKRKIIKL